MSISVSKNYILATDVGQSNLLSAAYLNELPNSGRYAKFHSIPSTRIVTNSELKYETMTAAKMGIDFPFQQAARFSGTRIVGPHYFMAMLLDDYLQVRGDSGYKIWTVQTGNGATAQCFSQNARLADINDRRANWKPDNRELAMMRDDRIFRLLADIEAKSETVEVIFLSCQGEADDRIREDFRQAGTNNAFRLRDYQGYWSAPFIKQQEYLNHILGYYPLHLMFPLTESAVQSYYIPSGFVGSLYPARLAMTENDMEARAAAMGINCHMIYESESIVADQVRSQLAVEDQAGNGGEGTMTSDVSTSTKDGDTHKIAKRQAIESEWAFQTWIDN